MTLYHWDLPQTLDWRERDTVERFAEYAGAAFEAFGDRVPRWVTINEPWIVGLLGYQLGLHAPGVKDLRASVEVTCTICCSRTAAPPRSSTAAARSALRTACSRTIPSVPRTSDAARLSDGYVNRWFLDPVLKGSYPDDMRAVYEERIGTLDFVRDDDLAVIGARSDFVGVNYYTRRVIRSAPGREPLPWEVVTLGDRPMTGGQWEVVPEAFTDLLVRLRDDYDDPPILITENGGDLPRAASTTRERIDYLHGHLAARARRDRSRASTSEATTTGRSWTTSSGRSGTSRASASSTSTTRRRSARSRTAAAGTPTSRGGTRCDDARRDRPPDRHICDGRDGPARVAADDVPRARLRRHRRTDGALQGVRRARACSACVRLPDRRRPPRDRRAARAEGPDPRRRRARPGGGRGRRGHVPRRGRPAAPPASSR